MGIGEINNKIIAQINNNPSLDTSYYDEAIEAVQVDYNDDDNSNDDAVFISSEPIDRDDFCEALSRVQHKDPDEQFKSYTDKIFELYDSDGDGKLTSRELGYLNDNPRNSTTIKIDNWSVYNSFSVYQPDVINSEIAGQAEETSETNETETGTNTNTSQNGELIVNSHRSTSTSMEKAKYTDEDIAIIADLCVRGIVDESYYESKMDEQYYTKLQDKIKELGDSSNKQLSEEDIINIANLINSGKAVLEAFEGNIDSKDFKDIKDRVITITDKEAEMQAERLYKALDGIGTDTEAIDAFLDSEDLSNKDKVLILSIYNQKYGSFLNAVDSDYSFEKEEEIEEKYAWILMKDARYSIQAAEKEDYIDVKSFDETSIALLCNEFYNGTAGRNGTSEKFVEKVLGCGSNFNCVVAIMAKYFDQFLPSEKSMVDCIEGDYSTFTNEDKFVNAIWNALAAYDKEIA